MKDRNRLIVMFLALWVLFCIPLVEAQEKPSLKVGAIFSVTGKARALGAPEKDTVAMVVDAVNQSGGINGFPLKLIQADDETSDAVAVAEVNKLIEQENVLAILGPSTSGISLKVKPIAEKARVPLISCAAAEAIVTPIDESKWIFKTPQQDSHAALRLLEHIKGKGIDKVAFLSETSPFGDQGRKQLALFAKELGLTVTADEQYRPEETDLNPHVKKVIDSKPGAVVNWSIVPTQTLVPKAMRKMGSQLPLYQSHGFGNLKFIEMAGDTSEGIIFVAGRLFVIDTLPDNHFQKSVLSDYKRNFEKKYGNSASLFGGHAYDAITLLVTAMKAKKVTPDMSITQARQAIRDGLEEIKGFVGTAGVFNLSPKDHCGLDKDQSLELLIVRGGNVIPLSQDKK